MNAERPLNHACFEAAVADLLGRAYEVFPEPVDVVFAEAFEEARAAGRVPGHCRERFSPFHSLYGSTLEFLRAEGVVRVAAADGYGAEGVTLTARGFLVLNAPLDGFSTEPPGTLGQRMMTGARKAGSAALAAAVGALMKRLSEG